MSEDVATYGMHWQSDALTTRLDLIITRSSRIFTNICPRTSVDCIPYLSVKIDLSVKMCFYGFCFPDFTSPYLLGSFVGEIAGSE